MNGDYDYNSESYANEKTTQNLASLYKNIIKELGEDINREGLQKTPERVAKAIQFLTAGYKIDPEALMKSALFKEDYQDMILVKDIEFYSLCEHHMLPFMGKAHVAYIPNNNNIVGLSKVARMVNAFARRLQVQERMTYEIRDCVENSLQPKGTAIVIEAQHLCMCMRGVQKQSSTTRTFAFSGEFLEVKKRSELLKLIS